MGPFPLYVPVSPLLVISLSKSFLPTDYFQTDDVIFPSFAMYLPFRAYIRSMARLTISRLHPFSQRSRE